MSTASFVVVTIKKGKRKKFHVVCFFLHTNPINIFRLKASYHDPRLTAIYSEVESDMNPSNLQFQGHCSKNIYGS